MSKIQTELVKATEVTAKRGEDRQEYLGRLMKGVADLNDKQWDGLSQDAQDWFNDAADAKNAKAKVLPDFPDVEEKQEEKEEPKTGRRGAAKDTAPAKPKVGVMAKITTKRGQSETGVIVELDDEVVVIKLGNGEETEFARSRVESIEVAGAEAAKDEPEEKDPVKVGATVTILTKRGKEITGKIVEIDDDVLVLDVDGKDEEFDRTRVGSIKVAGGKKAAPKEEVEDKPATRRGAAKEEVEDQPEGDGKAKRSSNPGVSVGTRIKEIIADDLDATEEDVAKILKKEGIEYRENTLKLNLTECRKFIEILRAAKHIKKA